MVKLDLVKSGLAWFHPYTWTIFFLQIPTHEHNNQGFISRLKHVYNNIFKIMTNSNLGKISRFTYYFKLNWHRYLFLIKKLKDPNFFIKTRNIHHKTHIFIKWFLKATLSISLLSFSNLSRHPFLLLFRGVI